MVGVPLPWDIYTKGNRLILRKGNMILNDKQRDQLLKLAVCAQRITPEDFTAPKPVNEPFNPFRRLDQVYASLDAMLARPASFSFMNSASASARWRWWWTKPCKNQTPALARFFLLPFTNYSSAHSLHVSLLLAILMQRSLASPLPERISLLSAALTMNIGTYEVQNQLYHQALPLSDNQRMEIDHHPEESVRILQDCFVGDELYCAWCSEHHENWEGSGLSIQDDQRRNPPAVAPAIPGRWWALSDAALLPRPGAPQWALSQVFMNRGKSIDMQYAAPLVKRTGHFTRQAVCASAMAMWPWSPTAAPMPAPPG